ncbi:hypothetical protein PoB_006091700 [Plakobranchus ocellatus]|uniref:Uncharacterized protein n=1 Tax=Plakobranchus ocellatus TaxID=259542 RepID=A0AAV4CRA0_9GAST|nr:hypothetical protein PoB_006091700 [Plakobranchus ocellatus]
MLVRSGRRGLRHTDFRVFLAAANLTLESVWRESHSGVLHRRQTQRTENVSMLQDKIYTALKLCCSTFFDMKFVRIPAKRSQRQLFKHRVRAPTEIQTERRTDGQSLLVMHAGSQLMSKDIAEQPECATFI